MGQRGSRWDDGQLLTVRGWVLRVVGSVMGYWFVGFGCSRGYQVGLVVHMLVLTSGGGFGREVA